MMPSTYLGARLRDGLPPDRTALHVMVVEGPESAASHEFLDGFRRRLEQLGRSPELVVVHAEGEGATLPGAGGTSAAPVDLVLALGSHATALAIGAHRGAPIIGALVARESALPDAGLAAAVVLEFPPEVELAWMRRLLPNVHRIGVLYSSDENGRVVAHAREIAAGLGVEIVARRVTSPSDLPEALTSIAASADVLWGIPDAIVLTPETAKAVLLASLRNRVPFVGLSAQWVRAGAVYALDRDYADLGAQTADAAVRLFGGASPRALGVVAPRTVHYSLNVRSADGMGLTFTSDLLRGATEVIR